LKLRQLEYRPGADGGAQGVGEPVLPFAHDGMVLNAVLSTAHYPMGTRFQKDIEIKGGMIFQSRRLLAFLGIGSITSAALLLTITCPRNSCFISVLGTG
jgi:hypothetical protein